MKKEKTKEKRKKKKKVHGLRGLARIVKNEGGKWILSA